MKIALWQIALIVFMVLYAVASLTNIQAFHFVWMAVLQGLAAAATALFLVLQR